MRQMRLMWMILFLVLPLAGLAYVLWHVWCVLPFPFGWRWAAVAVCAAAFLTLFLNFSRAIEHMPLGLASVCYETGSSSIFILLYAAMIFIVLDIGRLLRLVPAAVLHSNGCTAAVLLAVLCVIFTCGYARYRDKVRQPLVLETAKDVEHMRIVMMSDLHLGYHNRREELARWVDMVNAEHPDLVLIAGDIIDISVRPLFAEDMAAEFRRIEAPVYACMGNHEYYSGEGHAREFFADAGITLLRDSAATVGGLCIIGRDDRTNTRRKSVDALMADADKSKYVILLDHQPYHLEKAERAGVDFQFSGHTHHGQVWPVSWITGMIYENAFGACRRGRTYYYVSSGMGIWGGKFRIRTRSEYVVAEIRGSVG